MYVVDIFSGGPDIKLFTCRCIVHHIRTHPSQVVSYMALLVVVVVAIIIVTFFDCYRVHYCSDYLGCDSKVEVHWDHS
jgi:hypothetical protein